MTTIHNISEREPVFDKATRRCWLWDAEPLLQSMEPNWNRITQSAYDKCEPNLRTGWTHWSPDAPTAPTTRPEEPAPAVATHEGTTSLEVSATLSPAPQQGETPRTNGAIIRKGSYDGTFECVLPEAARTLERELNAAKAEVRFLRNVNDGLADECNKLSGENDRPSAVEDNVRLRAQLAAAQSEVGRLNGESTCHFMDIEAAIGKGRLLGGWSTATSEIATLRRERDEAQQLLADMAQDRDKAIGELKAVEVERDELRADKERLDWLDRNGYRWSWGFRLGALSFSPAAEGCDPSFSLPNFRAVIDAARSQEGSK